jgi:hypothetical protein
VKVAPYTAPAPVSKMPSILPSIKFAWVRYGLWLINKHFDITITQMYTELLRITYHKISAINGPGSAATVSDPQS